MACCRLPCKTRRAQPVVNDDNPFGALGPTLSNEDAYHPHKEKGFEIARQVSVPEITPESAIDLESQTPDGICAENTDSSPDHGLRAAGLTPNVASIHAQTIRPRQLEADLQRHADRAPQAATARTTNASASNSSVLEKTYAGQIKGLPQPLVALTKPLWIVLLPLWSILNWICETAKCKKKRSKAAASSCSVSEDVDVWHEVESDRPEPTAMQEERPLSRAVPETTSSQAQTSVATLQEASGERPPEEGLPDLTTNSSRPSDCPAQSVKQGARLLRSSTLDALSDERKELIQAMRAKIDALPAAERPPQRHDLCLKRFLAHGKWKLDKAFELYMEMEVWRRQRGIDSFLDQHQETIQLNRVLPIDIIGFYPYGYDKHGKPLFWMRIGHCPWWRAIFERQDEGYTAQIWMSEYFEKIMAARAEETGIWNERAVVIVDLSDLDYAYFNGAAMSSRARKRNQLLNVAQYYPGLIDKAYILNAPKFASRAWSILKQFLSKQLMEKAEMVSSEAEKKSMMEALGAEHIPRELGGLSEEPSYQLPDFLKMPKNGWSDKIAAWKPREINISRGATHEETFALPARCRLQWQLALTDSSIIFEIQVRATGGDWISVRDRDEIKFSDVEDPVYGDTDIPEGADGEVQLRFDNSSSKFFSKTVLLRAEVIDASKDWV